MEQLKLKNSKIIVMQLFDDIGFDLLPKFPVPAKAQHLSVEINEAVTAPSHVNIPSFPSSTATPNNPKLNRGFILFFIGVLAVTVGATLYLARKDAETLDD
jgi:hypothetical protein